MKKRIAILRGINVGGKRKILMKDLIHLFLELGHASVLTYIQSGNVVFEVLNSKDNIEIASEIEDSIFKKYGFEVPVIVLKKEELQNAISENPFFQEKNKDIDRLHITFLKKIPDEERLQNIKTFNFSPDQFEIKEKNVFIKCEGRYSQSKLTNNFFESKLKVQATTRNWKTILKLAEISKIRSLPNESIS